MGRWKKSEAPHTGGYESAKEREDKAFTLFSEMLIQKLEETKKSEWKQPWFAEGQTAWPKSLYGKPYHGMNALMLSLLCEKEGYQIPVFATHDRIFSLNFDKDEEGGRVPAVDKDGNQLPFLHVTKGEHSFPVLLSQMNIVHQETKEKIKWSDYVNLTPEEQKEYNIYHNRRVHYVFNVDQTNMKEARPELYAKLQEENIPKKLEIVEGQEFKFEPLDVMIDKQLWICPIKIQELKAGQSPHYSIKADEVVLGTKAQYQMTGHPESWINDAFHELSHSTGGEKFLNRFQADKSKTAYAREELVAEVSAAMCCHRYGIPKTLKEDSIPYVQNWLSDLHEKPEFIRTVLKDVKMATGIIDAKIDEVCRQYLGQDDKLDVREDEEPTLEYDEMGDAQLTEGERLGADKKQGASEVLAYAAEPDPEERKNSIHR